MKNFYSHTPHGVQQSKPGVENQIQDFYSHTPHGVQRAFKNEDRGGKDFYSHTPHGVQPSFVLLAIFFTSFLLTHPSRGATNTIWHQILQKLISTHTPLTGCNGNVEAVVIGHFDFYSHTPHGVQLKDAPM